MRFTYLLGTLAMVTLQASVTDAQYTEYVSRTRSPDNFTACQQAQDDGEAYCQGTRQGERCSTILTVLNETTHTCRVEFECCYGCSGGCPPGMTTECIGDQQPDVCGCCQTVSPIILDLGGDGISMSSAAGGAHFVFSRGGPRLKVGWPTKADDVWLALDRNENGIVDDGTELFGNTTPRPSDPPGEHGYIALSDLDANGDGSIDTGDPAFADLILWSDQNRNGISEPAELSLLRDSVIQSLSTEPRESRRQDNWGNRFRYRATVRASSPPLSRFSFDVFPVIEGTCVVQ